VTDDKTYGGMRKDGAGKEKTARIVSAKAGVGKSSKKGGMSSS
jgi:hypothetical protein